MMVKEQLLAILEQDRGQYVNGAELAQKIGATKAAVSKAAKVLSAEGYQIKKVPNKGYMLSGSILSAAGIRQKLHSDWFAVTVFKQTDSTNNRAKEAAAAGAKEGAVFVARSQTQGKGRTGRSFFSPNDSGTYFSLLLRPSFAISKAVYLTTMSAVSVVEALKDVLGVDAQIKWVNDVFVDGKKVCGISTEGHIDVESGKLDYAVIGIGINLTPPKEGFPNEIREVAGGATAAVKENASNELTAKVLENLKKYYDLLPQKPFLDKYREKCFLVGKRVFVGSSGEAAMVKEISEDFGLVVEYKDGRVETLDSGEVSVKL